MRQSNGVALMGANDPRGAIIGIIDVAPDDDRQSILTAILTQEKLERKETVLVLSEQSEAFRRPLDFKEFESTLHDLKTQLVFVLPPESSLTRVVRQHQYPVFVSLDNYAQYARQFLRPPNSQPPPHAEDTSPPDKESPPVVPPPADDGDEPTTPRASGTKDASTIPLPVPPDEPEGDEEIDESPLTQPASPIPLRASLFGRPTSAVSPSRNVSPPAQEEPAPFAPSAPPTQTTPSSRRRLPRLRWVLVVLVLLLVLVIGGILGTLSGVLPLAVLFPGITTATVTVTPDSQMVQQSYQIAAVTTQANSAQHQVQARFLSTTTAPPQTKTVPATGNGTYPARHAVGELTFYNALPQAQDVPKGTVVTDDQGVQVISDQDATVPPAQPPQEGNAIVQAHALLAGVVGNNFHLTAIRTCCLPGISVVSNGDFQGGLDASTYTYVQQSDIDAATSALKTTLMNTGQSLLKKQVAPSERLVGADQCLPDTASDHAAGEQAKTVTVTVEVTCTGEVYDQQATQQLAEDLLKTDAEKHVGSGYALSNHISTTINTVQKNDASGTLRLQVSASGLWSYQFGDAQKTIFARLIAGQKADQAVAILLQQPGVHDARVNLFLAYDNTLPGNPHQITIVWQPTS